MLIPPTLQIPRPLVEPVLDIARQAGSIKELIESAIAQSSEQQFSRTPSGQIGERGTPVRSVYPMRDKWKKYGKWWTVLGRDGDVRFVQGVGPVVPMVLQLFYFIRDDGLIEQLAWERPDLKKRWEEFGEEPSISIFGEAFIARYQC